VIKYGVCFNRYNTAGAFVQCFWWLPVAYAENFLMGCFHSVAYGCHLHLVCALCVSSQFDVIFIFPNQRFGEICWHDRHILLHALPLCCVWLHRCKTISASSWDIVVKYTQRYDTAVHNCRNACWNMEVRYTHQCVRAIHKGKMSLL